MCIKLHLVYLVKGLWNGYWLPDRSPQTGQDATSTHKLVTKYPENIYEADYKCVCLIARSTVNKNNELKIMIKDIDPHIIGITESWANKDIADAKLGRRGGGVILYIKESIQAYEIKLEREADCDEAGAI